jgi:hypothetical protein
MTTTLITPLVVAKEALISLENNMVMGNLVHRAYSPEFQPGVGATVVIRKPTTFTATAFTSTVGYSTITESSVAVVLDKHWDVSFQVTSQELSCDVANFSEQFIQPAVRAIAQAVDSDICTRSATAIAAHYPVTATPVVSDISGLEAVMDIMKVPVMDRRLVLNPTTKSAYIALDAFLNADKRGDGGQALRTAEIGRVMGFECYMDQNMPTFSQVMGVAFAAGTGTITGAWAAGATAGTVTGATGAVSTVNVGDCFKVTGYDEWFKVDVASTSSTAGIFILSSFSPAVKATSMTDGSVVTFQLGHRQNLAFHKNAIALVTAPLQPPIGGAVGAVANYNGLSCRVVYGYDQQYKKNNISIDFLCGVKMLDMDLAARLCDKR